MLPLHGSQPALNEPTISAKNRTFKSCLGMCGVVRCGADRVWRCGDGASTVESNLLNHKSWCPASFHWPFASDEICVTCH